MLNPVLYVMHVCIHKDYEKSKVHSNLAPTALAGIPCKQLLVNLPDSLCIFDFLLNIFSLDFIFQFCFFLQLFIFDNSKNILYKCNIIFFHLDFPTKKICLRDFSMLAILMAVWIYHNLFNQKTVMDGYLGCFQYLVIT